MIFHIPHSSRVIPADIRHTLVLDDAGLTAELDLMTDAFIDELFGVHARQDDRLLMFPVSRLVVDPERFVDDSREEMSGVGMGAVYTKTSSGGLLRTVSAHARRELLRRYYHPHHEALTDAAMHERAVRGAALIVDCHSFASTPLPHEKDSAPDRPDVCIGTDPFHTDARLFTTVRDAVVAQGWTVEENRPFKGTIVPGVVHGKDPGVQSVMIELNRSLYMDEGTGRKSARFDECARKIGEVICRVRDHWKRRCNE